MPRGGAWLVVVLPFVGGGCQVDSRTVSCDDACQQGTERTGGTGGEASATGGSSAIGGSSATGGTKLNGGAASGGAKASGGAGSAGATATAKGGSSSLGGSATAGTSGGVVDCGTNSVASGRNPLISDFESGDLTISASEGRAGFWTHVRSDTQPEPSPPAVVVSEGGNKFMRVSGLGIQAAMDYPWALVKTDLKGFGSGPAPASCVYDASAYRGIEFRARGVEVRVSIEMDLDMPESNTFGAPGACPSPVLEDCYNRHGFELKLTKNWDFYQLLWDDLAQRDYGAWHPDFDPSRLLGVYFEVVPDPVSNSIPGYQIDVDDVVFLP